MGREVIKETVQAIFRDILDNDSLVLMDDMKPATVEGWDSLTHIGIVTGIEKQFKIRFSLVEIDELKNVGQIIDAIQKKTGK